MLQVVVAKDALSHPELRIPAISKRVQRIGKNDASGQQFARVDNAALSKHSGREQQRRFLGVQAANSRSNWMW